MTTVQGNPDYFVDLNDGGSSGQFKIRDFNGGSPTQKFVVSDTGDVILYGSVTRLAAYEFKRTDANTGELAGWFMGTPTAPKRLSFQRTGTGKMWVQSEGGVELAVSGTGVHVNTTNSTGDICSFRANDTERLRVNWNASSEAQILADNALRIQTSGAYDLEVDAGGDIEIKADKSLDLYFNEDDGGDVLRFRANSSRRTFLVVSGTANWSWRDNTLSNAEQATLFPNDSGDCKLTLGVGDDTRGHLALKQDPPSVRPGVIEMEPADMTNGYTSYLFFCYDSSSSTFGLYMAPNPPTGSGLPTDSVLIRAFP